MTSNRRLFVAAAIAAVVIALGIALAVFKPWLLFVNTEVNDVIPSAAAPTSTALTDGATSATIDAATSEQPASQPADAGPKVVSQGEFVSHEHHTSGTVKVFELPDGTHQLALENLDTSNGPDVQVWFSKGPVVEGLAGLTTAGQYEHLAIAPIKGNKGNQVYDLPADFRPADWPTLDLWCEDFSVSFGAAALSAP